MKLIKDLSIGDTVFFYDIYNKSISITEVMVDKLGLYCLHGNKHYFFITKFKEFSIIIDNGYIILTGYNLNIVNDTLNTMIDYMNFFSFLLLSLHDHTELTTVGVTDDDYERLLNYDIRDSLVYNIELLFNVLSNYCKSPKINCDRKMFFSDIFGKLSLMVYDLQNYINILKDFIYLSANNYIK